jgi:hypothetical protein
MIVTLHNDDGTKTTYFGVSDFNCYDGQDARITQVFLNSTIDADGDDREFYHGDAEIHMVICEAVCNEEALFEMISDYLVEDDTEIVVGIPAISADVAYALESLRRDPEIDADDNLTIVGRPDPGFPDNDTSEVND